MEQLIRITVSDDQLVAFLKVLSEVVERLQTVGKVKLLPMTANVPESHQQPYTPKPQTSDSTEGLFSRAEIEALAAKQQPLTLEAGVSDDLELSRLPYAERQKIQQQRNQHLDAMAASIMAQQAARKAQYEHDKQTIPMPGEVMGTQGSGVDAIRKQHEAQMKLIAPPKKKEEE